MELFSRRNPEGTWAQADVGSAYRTHDRITHINVILRVAIRKAHAVRLSVMRIQQMMAVFLGLYPL